jgi:hypothetical protein
MSAGATSVATGSSLAAFLVAVYDNAWARDLTVAAESPMVRARIANFIRMIGYILFYKHQNKVFLLKQNLF